METPNNPSSEQANGAHDMVTLLRSTIATQHLPYQHGTEARALGSLYELLMGARKTMAKHPDDALAAKITEMLNSNLRPFTAKWHRLSESGGLNSRDGGDAFRGELRGLQKRLRVFAGEFHRMAYGSDWSGEDTPPVIDPAELASMFTPLAYGIPEDPKVNGGIPRDVAKEINDAEHDEIEARRTNTKADGTDGQDAVGLAFSGGGIRSATFSLGVAQVLADRALIGAVDLLSTVSGGGYTGGFLAHRLGEGTTPEELGGAKGPDPQPIRYLRLRAKYLAAGSLWEAWGMVCATLAGMLMNWIVPLLVITVAAIVATAWKGYQWPASMWVWGSLGGAFLALGSIPVYFARARRPRGGPLKLPVFTALFSVISLAMLMIGALDYAFNQILHPRAGEAVSWLGRLKEWKVAAFAALPALVPVVLRFVPVIRSPKASKVVNLICLGLAGLVVPLLGIAVFFLLRHVGEKGMQTELSPWPGLVILCSLAGLLTILAICFLDINLTAPFRLYRDGLRKTFVNNTDGDEERVPLDAANPTGTAPYHLINCTVNLPSSRTPKLRERKSDFFLFSKKWTGSPVIGYAETKDWQMNRETPDLASAIAISGAAFSSHMGLGSMPTLQALLTLLNVRLGYWIHQPGRKRDLPTDSLHHPGFSCLLREMTGVGMSERQQWINLSDGGHIENLATYELLRRRCKFIVCVDGEADPHLSFHGFMTLVRHAQIDFGVRIDADLDDIRPDLETGMSRSHYQLCRIHYPASADGSRPVGAGLLLYLKLSVTGNESELIKRYRGTHPDFPHQTTLDQFFDEEQFEVYRQLGAHFAEGLFAPCLMDGNVNPVNVHEWFQRLAGNLLEPEK